MNGVNSERFRVPDQGEGHVLEYFVKNIFIKEWMELIITV